MHALNNIVGLDAVFGIDNVLVIHHTGKGFCQSRVSLMFMCVSDCGLTHNTDESIRATLKDWFPDETASIEDMAFGAIEK